MSKVTKTMRGPRILTRELSSETIRALMDTLVLRSYAERDQLAAAAQQSDELRDLLQKTLDATRAEADKLQRFLDR